MNRARTEDPEVAEVALITGHPSATAQSLTREVLQADDSARVFLLAPAQPTAETLASLGDRVTCLVGHVASMDLGLAGSEYRDLASQVTTIHHLAQADSRAERDVAQKTNVGGTRMITQLAGDSVRLRRLCYWSSVAVSGKRKGMILEEDLDHSQSFHNHHEQTLFAAEKLIRSAMARLPVTVLRPGTIVCDSKTGAIDSNLEAFDLLALIARGGRLPVPVPASSNAPLHLVPIDFVVSAGFALSRDPRAAGQTFHLTDPNPLPARRVFELVAEHAHTKVAKRSFPVGIAKTLLRTPGLDRLSPAPRSIVDRINQQVFYNARLAAAILADHGIACPPFDSYVAELVRHLRSAAAAGPSATPAPAEEPAEDPFD